MKSTSYLGIILIILFASAQAFGQFTISGTISNYTGKESLKLNIPVVYGYNSRNDINIPIDKNGNFSINIPVDEKKFGDLIFQKTFFTFLLTPGKSLALLCKSEDSTVIVLEGNSAAENRLLNAINLRKQPSFLLQEESFYDSLTNLHAIEKKVIVSWNSERDHKIKEVNASSISSHDKALISSEIKFNFINYLQELRYKISNQKLANELYLYLYDSLSPFTEILPAGPEYYTFVRYYLGYLGPKTIDNKNKKGLNNNEALDFYNMSYDSANVVESKFGKPYLRWILANNIKLPEQVIERLTYKEINDIYHANDIRLLEPLVKVYRENFSNDTLNAEVSEKLSKLKRQLTENAKNKNIRILPNFETTSSIYDVIKSLRGNVVLLDVWGTWCGPCKEELKFLPQLKAKFKDQKVAYVYLDLDEENLDSSWRTFIITNNMEGLHLRKNRQNIKPFWNELLANVKDKSEYYPQYFIFDKTGKLVVSQANRPSETTKLYQQIEAYLN